MDKMDIQIILLLFHNSRLPFREIAKYVGLSVNAVYKRIQIMIDLGIIEKFTTKIKAYAINALYIFIFGQSSIENMNYTIISNIGKNDKTQHIILSSRNYFYIGAVLENIHQLDDYISFISQTANIQTPKIGFLSGVQYIAPIPYIIPKSKLLNYDKLDLEIIRSLHNNSRKPVSEIAKDIKSISGTIHRRLKRLIREGIIDLSIDFNPEQSNAVFAFLQISINPSIKKKEFSLYLNEKYHPNLFYCWTFSNLANIIVCWVWVNNLKELKLLVEKIRKEQIESVSFDLMYRVFYYDTWKEERLYK